MSSSEACVARGQSEAGVWELYDVGATDNQVADRLELALATGGNSVSGGIGPYLDRDELVRLSLYAERNLSILVGRCRSDVTAVTVHHLGGGADHTDTTDPSPISGHRFVVVEGARSHDVIAVTAEDASGSQKRYAVPKAPPVRTP